MTVGSAVGSMPGADPLEYGEAVRIVLGELPDLPALPEMPGRGPHADMVGRTLAVVADLDVDLQPAGWRLTGSQGSPGLDQRRARSLLAQDLDAVEELTQEHPVHSGGRFKTQVAGPWTLAATVEKPRGDRVLADHGARRDLAEALAEGLRRHATDLRRRLPDVELVIQLDEPLLPAVLAGRVPTASGFHRHRSVDAAGASDSLELAFAAVRESGATAIAHCCAGDAPVSLLVEAGAEGVSVDLALLAPSAYDAVAALLEAGAPVLLGVVPSTEPRESPSETALADRVLRFLDLLGFDPDTVGRSLVITPTCGLAGASPAWAREAIRLSRTVATALG